MATQPQTSGYQGQTRKRAPSFTLVVQYAICTLVALIVFIPIFATLMGGLKETGELMANPFGLPIPPRVENYTRILTGGEFFMPEAAGLIGLRQERGNLLAGDLIIAVGEIEILGLPEYLQAVSRLKPGEKVKLKYERGDEEAEVEVMVRGI